MHHPNLFTHPGVTHLSHRGFVAQRCLHSLKCAPERLPHPGELIDGRYLVLKELGRGGSGVVFKARCPAGRYVAIKMLLPVMLDHPSIRSRFLREAKLLAMASHRNTVRVLGDGLHRQGPGDGQPYIVMELLDGESLDQTIARGAFSVREVLNTLVQVLDSLSRAHQLGIIHRDLKPENIIYLTSGLDEGSVKVVDYGLGKAMFSDEAPDMSLTRVGSIAGTPSYMAPELAGGLDKATPASDIYAVGCIAYQMLTGQTPYHGKTTLHMLMAHTCEPLPRLDGALQDHPVEALILQAIAKQPEDRFADIIAMLQAVLDLQNTLTDEALDAHCGNASAHNTCAALTRA